MAHRQKRARTIVQRGELVAEVDPRRPSGRLLRHGGMDASYIDLADSTHLEFDYMRWLRIVLRAFRARRVLHIGGGACALARALAAENPGGLQEVCEVDADVLAMAREHLGLRRTPGLRVRHVEGRAYLVQQPDCSREAIVIDAFVGARVPPHLITTDALLDAARVAPLTLVNVVDNRSAREITAVSTQMAAAYPVTWRLGQAAGNTVVGGCISAPPDQLAQIAARAAADPSPARLSQVRRQSRSCARSR